MILVEYLYQIRNSGKFLHPAPVRTGQGKGPYPFFAAYREGLQDILGIARRRETHQDVTFAAQTGNQTGKDFVVAVVVGDGRQVRGVAVQGVGRQDGPVKIEPAGEFRCQMLGIGRAAAVAAEIHPSAVPETGYDGFNGLADGCFQAFIRFYAGHRVKMGPQAGVDYCCAVHVVNPSLQNSKS